MMSHARQLKLVFLFVLLLFPWSINAQTNDTASDPRIKEADALHKAGYESFLERDYRNALEAFGKELPLRRAAKDVVGEAWALHQIGECLSSLNETRRVATSTVS